MALSCALVVHVDKPAEICSASISPRCGFGWTLTKSRRLISASSAAVSSAFSGPEQAALFERQSGPKSPLSH
jgi:hypothetical protein